MKKNLAIFAATSVAGLVLVGGGTSWPQADRETLVVQAIHPVKVSQPTGDRILSGRLGEAFASGRFVREAELVRANAADSPPLLLEYSLTSLCGEPSTAATPTTDESLLGADEAGEAKRRLTVSVRPAPTATGTVLRVRAVAPSQDDALHLVGGCGDSSPTATRLLLPAPHRTKI